MSGFKAACVQLRSGDDVAENIRDAEKLIRAAAREGAQFIATPENTTLMAADGGAKLAHSHDEAHDPALPVFGTLAKELGVWLLAGSLAIKVSEKKTANRSFYRTFRVRPGDTEGRLLYDLGNGQWDIPALRELLGDVLPRDAAFDDLEVEHDFPGVGRKVMLLNARKLWREGNHTELILLAIEDVTALREAERGRRDAESRFTEMVKNVRDHSIFLTDPAGVITSWNVAAERILGLPRD